MTPRPRSARLLVNPVARRASRIDAEGALGRLRDWGLEATLVTPGSAADFALAARQAAHDGVELLLVAGGDGSLRLAAGAIANSPTALAALPAGTANVWARETGIPARWDAAIDAHVLGQRVSMDLGCAGGEAFLLMAGVGWDARIAARVKPAIKRRVGPGAYAVEAAAVLPRLKPGEVEIAVDQVSHHGSWGQLIIGNTRLYGGLVQFTPGAVADDGLLDLVAIGPRRRGEGALLALKLAVRRLQEASAVYATRGAAIEVLTPGLQVQLDGDVLGETPMGFSVQPAALRVSIPPGPLPPIFSGSPPKV